MHGVNFLCKLKFEKKNLGMSMRDPFFPLPPSLSPFCVLFFFLACACCCCCLHGDLRVTAGMGAAELHGERQREPEIIKNKEKTSCCCFFLDKCLHNLGRSRGADENKRKLALNSTIIYTRYIFFFKKVHFSVDAW